MASSRVAMALVEDVDEEEGAEPTAMAHTKAPLQSLEEEEVPHRLTHKSPHQTEATHIMLRRSGTIGMCAACYNTGVYR